MPKAGRLATTLVLLALVAGGVAFSVITLTSQPTNVAFTAPAGQPVNITLQTVGSYGSGIHPNWVSYLIESPQGQWVHSTLFQVPENTRINVTMYNYDSGSPLRNQQIGMVQGTTGGTATLNGKPFSGDQFQRRQRRRAHVLDPDASASTCRSTATTATRTSAARRRAPRARPTRSSGSRLRARVPATTHGSASCPAPPVGCTAMVGRCRPWAGWTVSCRWFA